MVKIVLSSKIHRAYVTNTDADYVGSIIVDKSLMHKAGIWDYEKVLVCDITNGSRWETYVLPGEPGSGVISVQGAAAKLCQKGDCVIILCFSLTEEPIEPRVILVDENNRFVQYLEGMKYEAPLH